MLDEEFKKQRARTVRDLAAKATDPFIKGRLLDLAARHRARSRVDRRARWPHAVG